MSDRDTSLQTPINLQWLSWKGEGQKQDATVFAGGNGPTILNIRSWQAELSLMSNLYICSIFSCWIQVISVLMILTLFHVLLIQFLLLPLLPPSLCFFVRMVFTILWFLFPNKLKLILKRISPNWNIHCDLLYMYIDLEKNVLLFYKIFIKVYYLPLCLFLKSLGSYIFLDNLISRYINFIVNY